MKRYYLTANGLFYGVTVLTGVKTILSTNNQGEAIITLEGELGDTIDFLEQHNISVIKREIPPQSNIGRRRNVMNS